MWNVVTKSRQTHQHVNNMALYNAPDRIMSVCARFVFGPSPSGMLFVDVRPQKSSTNTKRIANMLCFNWVTFSSIGNLNLILTSLYYRII